MFKKKQKKKQTFFKQLGNCFGSVLTSYQHRTQKGKLPETKLYMKPQQGNQLTVRHGRKKKKRRKQFCKLQND